MTDALLTAEKLLQADAIRLDPYKPFTWASGWKSPIYCDNRSLLSQPYIRDYIKSELCNLIFDKFSDAEIIAGVATAGIAWGAMVADQLKLPFLYVRPKPKEHGLGNQIEGRYFSGQKALIVEDLISTGKSSLQVISVLRENGVQVAGLVSIFSYQFEESKNSFEKEGIKFESLTNYPALLNLAAQKGIIKPGEEEILLKWRSDPANWKGLL